MPELTAVFANVKLSATFAVPSNAILGAVASPVILKFLAVCQAVAVPAFPVIVLVVASIVKLFAISL